jgi:hypothetical protein
MGVGMVAGAIVVIVSAVAAFRLMPNSVAPTYGESEPGVVEVPGTGGD